MPEHGQPFAAEFTGGSIQTLQHGHTSRQCWKHVAQPGKSQAQFRLDLWGGGSTNSTKLGITVSAQGHLVAPLAATTHNPGLEGATRCYGKGKETRYFVFPLKTIKKYYCYRAAHKNHIYGTNHGGSSIRTKIIQPIALNKTNICWPSDAQLIACICLGQKPHMDNTGTTTTHFEKLTN